MIDRLPRAVHILVGLVLIAGMCALIGLQLYPFWQQLQSGWEPEISIKTPTHQQTTRKLHNIASFELFGSASEAPAVVEQPVEKLPETRLRLTLTGVLAGQNDQLTGALIEGPDRNTDYYKVGDELPGNAKLHRVYPDRVVLERSGRLENLYFPESAAPMQAVQEFDNTPANPQMVERPAPTVAPERQPNVLSEERRQSIKDRLSNLRQRIINSRN
ncbi:MAG: type II secretion system protein N [Oleiphilaceae bacterium]|nr:type II secretion system protein N [Oleiphilaceae bacterium]